MMTRLVRLLTLLLWAGLFQPGLGQTHGRESGRPAIEVETPIHRFEQVVQGERVKHTFRVINQGDATLNIESVSPD